MRFYLPSSRRKRLLGLGSNTRVHWHSSANKERQEHYMSVFEELRAQRMLTKRDLANAVGIKPGRYYTISRYSGKRLRIKEIVRLCRFFEISPQSLRNPGP